MENEVLFSLKPKFAELIEKRQKNHEFRKYTPKKQPTRLWFYITAPISTLLYVADVNPVVHFPNKIPNEGYGNEDFNNGLKKAEFAFPITHLYKLKKPLTLNQLRSTDKFTAPQGFAYMSKYPRLYNDVINNIGLEKVF
ncbi:MAG: hypothetical protein ACD_22C00082G0012 [uncultured bacterium]|nr:MAG: hypothetical protein ACD_22C00082G0012 [uncultured bacterium]